MQERRGVAKARNEAKTWRRAAGVGRRPAGVPGAVRVLLALAVIAGGAGGLGAPGGGRKLAAQAGPPVLSVTQNGQALADGSWFNRPVTPVITASGGTAPVTVSALLDGVAFTSGTAVPVVGAHQLAVTAVDAAGAQAAPVTVGFTIKTAPPVFQTVSPASGTITAATQVTVSGTVDSAVSVTVAGQAATLVGGTSFSGGPVALAEGTNNLTVTAVDAAGNSASTTVALVRDTTAPVVAIGSPGAGTVLAAVAVDVTGTVSDAHLATVTVNGIGAGVTGGQFRAPQVPLSEGSTTLTAVATDQAGNVSQSSVTVVRDTQAPALAITNPADGTVVPGASLTVGGVASDPHLSRVTVNGAVATLVPQAGGASSAWSAPVSLQAGANTVTAQAVDTAGNASTATITVTRDSSVPQVSITQPADGSYLSAATVGVSGTVEVRNGLVVTVNGAPATVAAGGSGSTSFAASGVALVEGANRLVARATDPAGNQGVASVLVYRDTVAPQLASSNPASGAQSIGLNTVFQLTFSEPIAAPAAGSWSLKTAGGQSIAATAALAGSVLAVTPSAALPSAASLQLVLTAGITDLAGNALASPPVLAFTTLNTAAPAAPVLSSLPAMLCAPSVTLSGTAAAGSLISVTGGAAAAQTQADATSGAFTVAVLLAPGSVNRLQVTAAAAVTGAVSLPATVQVVDDCAAPYVVGAKLAGGGSGSGVVIVFDKPVAAATLAGAVTVTGPGGAVAGAVTLAADGKTATFTPAPAGTALPAGVLRLDVSVAVEDLAGNALAYPFFELFGGASETGSSFVVGTAIDDSVGRPLAGALAMVTATNGAAVGSPQPQQLTGTDGTFSLAVPEGTQQLSVTRPGYTPSYRTVAVRASQGASVFAPRLTPEAGAQSVAPGGGTVAGTPAGGAVGSGGNPPAAASLAIPGGSLSAATPVSLTGLDEQGLPLPLPYGWSPRGAAWLDTGGAALSGTATLTLPVEEPDGSSLAVVWLSAAAASGGGGGGVPAAQWQVVSGGATVAAGVVSFGVTGVADGAYAAVDPDTLSWAPAAPAAAVAGSALPASAAPAGTEVSAATMAFNPSQVLPSQTSQATAQYTVAAGGVASGMPLSLSIGENLTLLDGTTRQEPPFGADLVLYHAADGTPRSRFQLAPSQTAQSLPISLGSDVAALRAYSGAGPAPGNVVGPGGGSFADAGGDTVTVPAGALAQPAAVSLAPVAAGDLALPAPAGTTLDGALRLDLGGQTLSAAAGLTLVLPAAPPSGAEALLLEETDFGSGPVLRPVAALVAAGSAWTTVAAGGSDLPWVGVTQGAVYLFVRTGGPIGYVHGTVSQAGGAALGGAVVKGGGLGWSQQTAGDGTYVLPVPVGTVAVAALDPATGNTGGGSATIAADQAEVELDLTVQAVPLAVVSTVPAGGATAVLLGIQPTVTFNRPIDPTTVTGTSGGIQLLQVGEAGAGGSGGSGGAGGSGGSAGEPVPVDITVAGAVATVTPQATLLPNTAYQLLVTPVVRDPYGTGLPSPVTAAFTTQTLTLPSTYNVARIFLVQPDDAGNAAVVGQAGALPAGALAFVENTGQLISTPSVTVGQDGSFNITVQADLTDTLLLHVLVTGSNEVILPLGPFHTADLSAALVDAAGESFATGAGVSVTVPAGAFSAPTWVQVTPAQPSDPLPAPAVGGLTSVYGYTLGFTSAADGSVVAGAAAGLQIGVPAPSGAPAASGGIYLVQRAVTALGQSGWMLMDFAALDGSGQTIATTATTGPQRAGAGTAAGRRAAAGAAAALALQSGEATSITTRDQAQAAKLYLPGSAFPGQYQIQAPQVSLGYMALPIAFGADIGVWTSALDNELSVINQATADLLSYDSVLIPTLLNRPTTITVRSVSTGYILFSQTFAPPASSTPVVVPPETLGDGNPPLPTGGSPIRFFLLQPGTSVPPAVDQGITVQVTGTNLSITGAAGSATAKVNVLLTGIDDSVAAQTQADGTGAFSLSQTITLGRRYLLAIGSVVSYNQPLVVSFSRAIDSKHTDIDVLDTGGASVVPQFAWGATHATLSIAPSDGWVAGQSYTLHFGPKMNDGFGDAWGKALDLPFQAAPEAVGSSYSLPVAYNLAEMGSELFVAADTAGLLVLDASNPQHLVDIIPGTPAVSFPFPYNDPVRGVTVDPHGRVIVVGGGVAGFGQLKIFDPQMLTPQAIQAIVSNPGDSSKLYAPFRGSTIISDSTTNATTNLPEGLPRRVATLSNDTKTNWIAGGATPPTGLTLTPATPPAPLGANGDYSLTVAGGGAVVNHPVTLLDQTLGRMQRVDPAADGTFTITLSVRPDDQLQLLVNANSLAYVATPGVGVEVVDDGTVYNKSNNPTALQGQSDVLGIYSGFADPKLLLCGQPVDDIASVVESVGVLFDPANAHPLVVPALVGDNGVVMLEGSLASPGTLNFLNDICVTYQGSNAVTGLAVVQGYIFDWSGNGQLNPARQGDYLVITHRTGGVLVYDVTDRTHPQLISQIPVPGQAADVTVDTINRRLYVSGLAGGLYVIDFNAVPHIGLIDNDHNNTDDRVLATITVPGNTDAPAYVMAQLGLVLTAGQNGGLDEITTGGPQVTAIAYNLPPAAPAQGQPAPANPLNGGVRQVNQIAPFGVPTASEGANGQNRPGLIRFQAALPGFLGATIKLDVLSLGASGAPIAPAGDSTAQPTLPMVALTGPTNGVTFTRMSAQPYDQGYNLYQSDPIAVLADLKASSSYVRSDLENQACVHCNQTAENLSGVTPRELLSGDSITVQFPAGISAQLSSLYSPGQLTASQIVVPSVRWEMTPAPVQEPPQGAAPVFGVLLHSGEYTQAAADLRIAERGLDVTFERTYRSQAVGAGPLGPGWDHNFDQRLRELPNGDVEYYDGRGRRDVFHFCQSGQPSCLPSGQSGQAYVSPPGVFSVLSKVDAGFQILTPRHALVTFDTHGRLTSIADEIKQDDKSGNQLTFSYDINSRLATITDAVGREITLSYDSKGRLTSLTDFDQRTVTYTYDTAGRLATVTSPSISSVTQSGANFSPTNGGVVTTYSYMAPSGDLAGTLSTRDKLVAVEDGKGQTWLRLAYQDLEGSGRSEDLVSATRGSGEYDFDYTFDLPAATVNDADGNETSYVLTPAGQITQVQDEDANTVAWAFDGEGLPIKRTDPLGRITTYTWDSPCTGSSIGQRRSRGDLTSIDVAADTRGANGSAAHQTTCITYESYSNQPATIVDPRGATTQFTRDLVGEPTMIVRAAGSPAASTTQYAYNGFGQPTSQTDPLGTLTTYTYSALGYPQQQVVAAGSLNLTTLYETDDRGNVTAVTDPRGVRDTLMYNALDWRTSLTLAAGAAHDGASALNYTTTWVYDADGKVVEEQRPSGTDLTILRQRHVYGPLGEVLSEAQEIGGGVYATNSYTYDANLNLTRIVAPMGQTTTITYDERNLPIQRTRGGAGATVTEVFAFDEERQLTQFTDGNTKNWLTQYDGYGRVAAKIDPLGNATQATYDAGDEVLQTSAYQTGNVLLAQTNLTYDLLGRRTAAAEQLFTVGGGGGHGVSTVWQYDPASNVTSVTDPLGRTQTYLYDAASRPVGQTDPAGNQLQMTLDGDGNAVSTAMSEQFVGGGSQAPVTTTILATFDALNRPVSKTDGMQNTTSYLYDAHGNLAQVSDPEGNTTVYGWDGLDNNTLVLKPDNSLISYLYDASSRRTTFLDNNGNPTTYNYDALDRRTATTYPDGQSWTANFDANDNPIQTTDANGTVVNQTFDVANRLTARTATSPGSLGGYSSESFSLDGLGRIVSATSSSPNSQDSPVSLVTTFAYDSLSRVTQEVTGGKAVTTTYNDSGDVTGVVYPSGLNLARTYDPLGRPLTVATVTGSNQVAQLGNWTYRGPDLVAGVNVAGGGLTESLQFDSARRTISDNVTSANLGGVLGQTVAWTPSSLLTGFQRSDTGTRRYAYDPLRVTQQYVGTTTLVNNSPAQPLNGSLAGNDYGYTYDIHDNRTDINVGGSHHPVESDSRNRPSTSQTGDALVWDHNGNLIRKGTTTYQYDFHNRLTDVSGVTGPLAHYDYDAFNRRINRKVSDGTHTTVWDGWRPIEDYNASGLVEQRRTHGLDLDDILNLELSTPGTQDLAHTYFPIYDVTGNLASLVSTSTGTGAPPVGTPVEFYDYDPYGNATIHVNRSAPQVRQVRVVGNDVWVEVSHAVLPQALSDALAKGALTLFDVTTERPLTGLTVTQPGERGPHPRQRLVLSIAGSGKGASTGGASTGGASTTGANTDGVGTAGGGMWLAGHQVRLSIAAEALKDRFLRKADKPYSLTFTWPASDGVVAELEAPQLEHIGVRQGKLTLVFSAEPDQASAAAAIHVDGANLAWTVGDDRYTLIAASSLPPGQHQIEVGAALTSLGGTALKSAVARSFALHEEGESQSLFDVPDDTIVTTSAVGNLYGFQGHAVDPETGFVYFRNRYYDPASGVFITPDPLEYVDGPSMYAFEQDNPANGSDPLGLCFWITDGPCSRLADAIDKKIDKLAAKSAQGLPPTLRELNRRAGHLLVGPFTSFLRIGEGPGKITGNIQNPSQFNSLKEAVGAQQQALLQTFGDLATLLPLAKGAASLLGAVEGGTEAAVPKVVPPKDYPDPVAVEPIGVMVYRVQGGALPKASKIRLIVGERGEIHLEGSDMLHINVNQPARAAEYLARRGEGAHVIQFRLKGDFVAMLRSTAIPQGIGKASLFPGRPQIVDATKAIDQYGIPNNMFDEFLSSIVPGSGIKKE